MTEVKINLGAGQAGLSSWINVDIGTKYVVYKFLPLFRILKSFRLISPEVVSWIEDSGKPPPNWKRWDITRRTPLDDNSVDYVYCSEVIEHFPKYQARLVMKETFRILKRGGIFRLTTPDIQLICSGYLSGVLGVDHFNDFFFMINQDKKPTLLERIGARIYSTNPHLYLYDYENIRNLLEDTGFIDVVKKPARHGRTPDLELLEQSTPIRDQWLNYSMYVECIKPLTLI